MRAAGKPKKSANMLTDIYAAGAENPYKETGKTSNTS